MSKIDMTIVRIRNLTRVFELKFDQVNNLFRQELSKCRIIARNRGYSLQEDDLKDSALKNVEQALRTSRIKLKRGQAS